jgi:hypothetical protein
MLLAESPPSRSNTRPSIQTIRRALRNKLISCLSAAPSHDRPWKSLLLQNGGALILRLPCQPPSSRPPSPSPCTQARHPAMAGALRALRSRHLLHRMCAACADPSTSYALVPILSPFPALLPFWPNSLNTHTISLRLEG